jgi:hypothetical protein
MDEEKSRKKRGFTKLYNEAIDLYLHLPNFDFADLGFYAIMRRLRYNNASSDRHGTVRLAYVELAAHAGMAKGTAESRIKRLVAVGLVEIDKITLIEDGLKKCIFHVREPLPAAEFHAKWSQIGEFKAASIEKAQRENKASRERMKRHRAKAGGDGAEEAAGVQDIVEGSYLWRKMNGKL